MYAVQPDDPEIKAMLIYAYITRAEKLEAEIKELNRQKSQIFKEARAMSLSDETMRSLMALRRNYGVPSAPKTPQLLEYEHLFYCYEKKHNSGK